MESLRKQLKTQNLKTVKILRSILDMNRESENKSLCQPKLSYFDFYLTTGWVHETNADLHRLINPENAIDVARYDLRFNSNEYGDQVRVKVIQENKNSPQVAFNLVDILVMSKPSFFDPKEDTFTITIQNSCSPRFLKRFMSIDWMESLSKNTLFVLACRWKVNQGKCFCFYPPRTVKFQTENGKQTHEILFSSGEQANRFIEFSRTEMKVKIRTVIECVNDENLPENMKNCKISVDEAGE